MKKALPFVLLLSSVFYSCSKEENDNSNTLTGKEYSASATMSGKIDDRVWGASDLNATVNTHHDGTMDLIITGTQAVTGETQTLILNNYTLDMRSYALGSGHSASAMYMRDTYSGPAISGNVIIVYAAREAIKGTYWFVTKDDLRAEGTFTVAPVYTY